MIAGALTLMDIIAKDQGVAFDPAKSSSFKYVTTGEMKKKSRFGIFGKLIFLVILIFLFIKHPRLLLFFLLFSGIGGPRGRSSGGFGGGGFGGFGGGLSGGGGSSGSW